MDYVKKHGPRAYPVDYKRCMECGEIIPWNDDCSYEHFAQIGREIRRKAHDAWGPKQTTRRTECKPDSGPSSSEQHSLLD